MGMATPRQSNATHTSLDEYGLTYTGDGESYVADKPSWKQKHSMRAEGHDHTLVGKCKNCGVGVSLERGTPTNHI